MEELSLLGSRAEAAQIDRSPQISTQQDPIHE